MMKNAFVDPFDARSLYNRQKPPSIQRYFIVYAFSPATICVPSPGNVCIFGAVVESVTSTIFWTGYARACGLSANKSGKNAVRNAAILTVVYVLLSGTKMIPRG